MCAQPLVWGATVGVGLAVASGDCVAPCTVERGAWATVARWPQAVGGPAGSAQAVTAR